MYRAPTPRERERWHALWLRAQGWPANRVAEVLERDPHTIGSWLGACDRYGPAALASEHTGGAPALGAVGGHPPPGLTVARVHACDSAAMPHTQVLLGE